MVDSRTPTLRSLHSTSSRSSTFTMHKLLKSIGGSKHTKSSSKKSSSLSRDASISKSVAPTLITTQDVPEPTSVESTPTSTTSTTPITPTPVDNGPARTTPTRRPAQEAPPPAYSERSNATIVANPAATSAIHEATADSPYVFLKQFDTVFIIDDSGSMAGRSWRETAAALSAITPVCTAHDADGIDIYFLNHRNSRATDGLGGYTNVQTTATVNEIFSSVRPLGGTPTGTRLNQILKPYLAQLEAATKRQGRQSNLTADTAAVKPLNIIVITDGVPSDDVESVIVKAARKLDDLSAEPWQVGVQFFQVGEEPEAAEELRELDDALSGQHRIRDIVDTVPWTGGNGNVLSADGLLKVTMGSVNRRLDRRRGSDERLRR